MDGWGCAHMCDLLSTFRNRVLRARSASRCVLLLRGRPGGARAGAKPQHNDRSRNHNYDYTHNRNDNDHNWMAQLGGMGGFSRQENAAVAASNLQDGKETRHQKGEEEEEDEKEKG
mmetsp:Transcript_13563/g.24504  ORF Transcript_13563/g.24504 Transcript_13563/m.24504 type:complete len:116 (+) Transcript_13563:1040-1387(+)